MLLLNPFHSDSLTTLMQTASKALSRKWKKCEADILLQILFFCLHYFKVYISNIWIPLVSITISLISNEIFLLTRIQQLDRCMDLFLLRNSWELSLRPVIGDEKQTSVKTLPVLANHSNFLWSSTAKVSENWPWKSRLLFSW